MSDVCRTKHHLVVVLYMPSAVAEAEAAAMDNAVDVWRLITASRLQYAAPRRMRRAVAPDVWHHRLKADGPSLCAVRKRQGEEYLIG